MVTKEWPFSLDLLPVQGIDSPIANIEFIRGRLINTLTIIDGVLKVPTGLPGDLKQSIYNVRYYVIVGISLADAALRSGFSYLENASTVEGLMEAVDSHIIELQKIKPAWNAWVQSAKKDQHGFGLDGDMAVPSPIRSRFMRSVAMPISTGDYIGSGLTTAGLFQLTGPTEYGDTGPIISPDQTVNTPAAQSTAEAMQKALSFGNVGKFFVALGIGIAAWFVFKTKEK